MPEMKWTDNQRAAIEHRGSSMIVSAAAGSGKTAVLVERVIRLMDETDIDRMLVVTFTNAAATGMKQKIHQAILKRLETPSSEEEVAHFSRQLSLLHNANINTLHSFCSKFVREHFDALSLSPGIKLGDTSQLNMMLSDAFACAIEEAYETQDADFLTFASEVVAKPRDDVIQEIIASLYPFLMSLPNPEKWLDNAVSLYEQENADLLLSAPVFVNSLKFKVENAVRIAEKNLIAIADNPDYDFAREFFDTDLEYAKKMYDAFSEDSYSALEDAVKNLPKRKSVTLKSKSRPVEISDFLAALREPYKKAIAGINDVISSINSYAIVEMMRLQKSAVRSVCKLTKRSMELYNAEKAEKEILDFNDLEHLTLKLLYDENGEVSDLAKTVSKEFSCIVVDEYQDINPVQEAIITAISDNKNNLFMVGDIKQGIYGFRNTVPTLFSEKVESYSRGDGGKCVYLSDNFRSRDSVLDFANLIFSQLMSPSVGGTPYTDTEALHKKGTFHDAEESAEVYVITDESLKKDTITAEALFCAKKIHEMIENKMQVTAKDGTLKPIGYGDIAILLRATKNVAVPFCEVLSACGIPVYCDALSENFLDASEIQSLISFLKAFSNPLQDTHLLSAFTSPVFGEPDYDLVVRIKLTDKKAPLYTCMKKFPETEEGYERVSEFLEFMDIWQKKAMHLSPARLISEFLSETGFAEYMEALKGGTQRLSNIRYLQSLADSMYPGAETGGLYSFLKYLDKHNKNKAGLSSPKILPDNAELVQVTTIHKSKGLEYPVVFIPRTGQPIQAGNNREQINFHREFGIGLPYKNAKHSLKMKSPVFKIIQNIKKSEELSEELRVLYVALTRAVDKTIVVGFPENIDNTLEYASLSEGYEDKVLPEGVVTSGKTYLDWILCALKREELRPEGSEIKVEFIDKIEIPKDAEKEISLISPKEPGTEVDARLSYEYPYLAHSSVYSKVSVTELKRLSAESDENAFKPYIAKRTAVSFEDEKSALKKGTVTHYILENADFSETDAGLAAKRLVDEGRLTKEELEIADIDAVNRFFASPLCKKLQTADEIYKELPFNIHIDAKHLSESAEGETVQLQGTIDCIAIFGDTILIVDFKTDKITNSNLNERIELYRTQLEYYKLGVQKLFPGKNISASIYFLSIDHEERLF